MQSRIQYKYIFIRFSTYQAKLKKVAKQMEMAAVVIHNIFWIKWFSFALEQTWIWCSDWNWPKITNNANFLNISVVLKEMLHTT